MVTYFTLLYDRREYRVVLYYSVSVCLDFLQLPAFNFGACLIQMYWDMDVEQRPVVLCVTTIHQPRQDTSWLSFALLSPLAISISNSVNFLETVSIQFQFKLSCHCICSQILKHKNDFIISVYLLFSLEI